MEEQRLYRYGVQIISDKLRTFVVRSGKPQGIVLFEEEDIITVKDANKRAEEMLAGNSGRNILREGSVACHSDSDGHHHAIILRVKEEYAYALFFTSNPLFGKREATEEEIALAGFIQRKGTYLAPVVRPKYEFSWRNIMYPKSRTEELWNEFEEYL